MSGKACAGVAVLPERWNLVKLLLGGKTKTGQIWVNRSSEMTEKVKSEYIPNIWARTVEIQLHFRGAYKL